MKITNIFCLFMVFTLCACGENDDDNDGTEMMNSETGDICADIESNNDKYEPKFTQFILRDVSDSACPMLNAADLEADDSDNEDITVCTSELQDNSASLCSAVFRCTTTDSGGLASETQAFIDLDEDESFSGVLEVEVIGIFCSYAVTGTLEEKN